MRAFAAMAELAGSGIGRRPGPPRWPTLFGRATADEQEFLGGLVFGELRQGALEAQVQEGLAAAYAVPVATVRRAAMLLSSTTAAAAVLLRDGLAGLDAVGLQVGVGIQPMLAASAPTPAEAVAKSGLPALVDYKLDGIRVQVHRDGDEVRDLHPQPGRHHRPAARGGGDRPGAAARAAGPRRRGAGAARRRHARRRSR